MEDATPATDIDGAWKEAFHNYIEPFFAFCLPEVHADIDWSRGAEFLDKELQKIVPDSEEGRGVVDLLVRVWRRDGEEQWVLIHIEVQAQYAADFPERMFRYYYRLVDKYGRPIASFAVLADDNPNWKPDRFERNLWGCKLDFRFPIVKLTDFERDRAKLEQSDNPFAVIILAHLDAMRSAADPEKRSAAKIRMIRSLYTRWGRDEIRKLVRLIDWLLKLPRDLELRVRDDVYAFEQEKQMPFITSFERIAMEEGLAKGKAEGLQDGIELGLKLKFGEEGVHLMPEIRQITDLNLLHRIVGSIERSSNVADVRRTWTE